MVNKNWAIYEGAEIWEPTTLNSTTDVFHEKIRSENVNNFASFIVKEQNSNKVLTSTFKDKISYCKGTMCEQNRRRFYVKAFFFYYYQGILLTNPDPLQLPKRKALCNVLKTILLSVELVIYRKRISNSFLGTKKGVIFNKILIKLQKIDIRYYTVFLLQLKLRRSFVSGQIPECSNFLKVL